ncbi:ComF family protein [Sporolactobacillus sp. THM7-7]|nr:ComF family protein [Sporolactobacillus sp. THM7-7]
MNEYRCLFCRGPRDVPLRFRTLLAPVHPPGLCRLCLEKMAPIDRKACCLVCGRDLRQLKLEFIRHNICNDCMRWKKSGRGRLFGRNRSIFSYNKMMKEMMTAFKFRGDALLAEAFRKDFRDAYRQMIGIDPKGLWNRMRRGRWLFPNERYVVVPIPLTRERFIKRGFNQSAVLAELLGEPIIEALSRAGSQKKQSKKNRRERLLPGRNPFALNPRAASAIAGRRVLLIDDIYTTGATLRLACDTLEAAGPDRVDALTLAHG